MYYQKSIFPLDAEGHFVVATYFAEHEVGGEVSRESGQAKFVWGHIDAPTHLTDITGLCCFPRPPSDEEAEFHRSSAEMQLMLSESDAPVSQRAGWRENHFQFLYEAELAEKDSLFVPRHVLASRSGVLVVGAAAQSPSAPPTALMRAVDVKTGTILVDHSDDNWPAASGYAGPRAISHDAAALLLFFPQYGAGWSESGFSLSSLPDLRSLATFGGPFFHARVFAGHDRWVVVEDSIHVLARETLEEINTFPLPKACYSWASEMADAGRNLVCAGDKGQISVVDLDSGSTVNYFPHRGCKRDEFARVAISGSGEWMASRVHCQSQLVVTDLRDGRSWPVGELEDELITESSSEEFTSTSPVPAAFAFLGERLLVSDKSGLRELSFSSPLSDSEAFVSEQGKPGARKPIRVPAKPTLQGLVKAASLQDIAEQVALHYSPAVKIRTVKPKKSGWYLPGKKGAPALGASRFGGWPDAPANFSWPRWRERPMSFLAQINLAEAHACNSELRLPDAGSLLFFLACGDDTYDNESVNRETYMVDLMVSLEVGHNDAWQVLYVPDGADLVRHNYDETPAPDLHPPCMLKFVRGGLPLPDENTAAYDVMPFSDAQRENYNEVVDLLGSEQWDNQMMGYPNLIQSTPPEFTAALASSGRDPHRYPERSSREYQTLLEDASEWGLLLQLTSDGNAGFLWGDGGHIYFYGKRDAMAAGDFSGVWFDFEN